MAPCTARSWKLDVVSVKMNGLSSTVTGTSAMVVPSGLYQKLMPRPWLATLPPHLNINTIELMPVSQSWAGFAVERREG